MFSNTWQNFGGPDHNSTILFSIDRFVSLCEDSVFQTACLPFDIYSFVFRKVYGFGFYEKNVKIKKCRIKLFTTNKSPMYTKIKVMIGGPYVFRPTAQFQVSQFQMVSYWKLMTQWFWSPKQVIRLKILLILPSIQHLILVNLIVVSGPLLFLDHII